MNCANHSRKNCAQGHQPCPTPWTCGGYANEAHYSAMQAPARPVTPLAAVQKVERWGLRVLAVLIFLALVFGPYLWRLL